MDRERKKVPPAAAKKPAAKKPAAKKGEILLPSSDCPPGWQRSKSRRGNSKTYDFYITAPGGRRFDRQPKLDSFLRKIGIKERIFLKAPRLSAAPKTTAPPAFGGFGLSTATSTTAAAAPSLNIGASAPATTTAASTGSSLSGGAASTGFSLGGASSASPTSSSTGGCVTTTTAASGGLSLGGITAASSRGLTTAASGGLGAASGAQQSLISQRNFAGTWEDWRLERQTGFQNSGNMCYVNNILHCFANTSPLAHYVLTRRYEEDLNTLSQTHSDIAIGLHNVLREMLCAWVTHAKSISASDFKSRVGRYRPEFDGRDQQDSHAFLQAVIETLHDDLNQAARSSPMPEQDNQDKQDAEAARTHWINYLERNQSIMVQLFCGQERFVVKCLHCKGESVTYREFTNLTVPLPKHSKRTSLQECMDLYLREEKIGKFKCNVCQKTGAATKKNDIVKFPPILIISLKRFHAHQDKDGMWKWKKKKNSVTSDLKNWDLSRMAVSGFDNKHSRFNLYAVSNQIGELEGGHYTAHCFSDVLKKWYKFNDQDVEEMDAGDVVTPNAYIFFFTAIEGETSLPPLGPST